MLVVVDYGMGNPGSILNMLDHLGIEAAIGSDPEKILKASKLILPGVGAFDAGIKNLKDNGLTEVLQEKVMVQKTPILGICLGMQLMTISSDEGVEPGFGWVEAYTKKFSFDAGSTLHVPHMGWNTIELAGKHPLLMNMDNGYKYYFVHSYYVSCVRDENRLAVTNYGHDFDSMISDGHIFGCQFHPEKSHTYGMQLFKNFHKI